MIDLNSPVMTKDFCLGLLIRLPTDDPGSKLNGLCGVQVPGEDDVRWIPVDNIVDAGNGALMEKED